MPSTSIPSLSADITFLLSALSSKYLLEGYSGGRTLIQGSVLKTCRLLSAYKYLGLLQIWACVHAIPHPRNVLLLTSCLRSMSENLVWIRWNTAGSRELPAQSCLLSSSSALCRFTTSAWPPYPLWLSHEHYSTARCQLLFSSVPSSSLCPNLLSFFIEIWAKHPSH